MNYEFIQIQQLIQFILDKNMITRPIKIFVIGWDMKNAFWKQR